jgi:uncharacterized protein DUF6544
MPYGLVKLQGVWLRQSGEMRLTPSDPWFPFQAEQTFGPRGLDFRWRAKMKLNRILPATITDSFVFGDGDLSVRLFGLFRVAHYKGPAVDKGEAMRALAEMPWRPFGFTEQQGITWHVSGDGILRATYYWDELRASVAYKIDGAGRVSSITATDRPRVVGQSTIETPWSGTFDAYREFTRVRIPTEAEVVWQLAEGAFPCWRAKVVDYRLTPN